MTDALRTALEAVLTEASRCSVDVHGFFQYFDRTVIDRLREAFVEEDSP